MKKNKGITLIALIITIIVMLILVAVSVNILVDSDLIGAVEKTGDAYKNAQANEGSMGEITIGGVKYDSIEDYINDNPSPTIKIKLSMTNKPEEVTAGGNVSAIKEGAPIPTGFYYVGGTLNTGVVISDDADDLNKGDGHDVVLEGNQFVWVPVLQNQKLKIEVTSEEKITSIKIEDPKGAEITTDAEGNEIVASGTTFTTEIRPTINGTYTVRVNPSSSEGENTGTALAVATLEVSSLYAQEFFRGEAASDYTDTVTEAQQTSVNTYGGFYIARYEAGTETARKYSEASDVTATVYSKKNLYPYTWISQENAITKSAAMYSATSTPAITTVTSALPNAAAWDRTLNWLVETKAVTEEQAFSDSTCWGNYADSYVTFTGKYGTFNSDVDGEISWDTTTSSKTESSSEVFVLGTGVSEYTKRNNIYDLAGNYYEWTTEVYSSGDVILRGGFYYFDGDNFPASFRFGYSATDSNSGGFSFRPVLYINQ